MYSPDVNLILGVVWTFFGIAPKSKVSYWPIQPPSYPLAVRNPYLSTWIPGQDVAQLPSSSPQFWAGQSLTWGIMVRVDGVTYNVFGIPKGVKGTKSAVVGGAGYTSTHSTFTMTAGPAHIKLDFFSPVSPSNYLRQSLPFSYLTVTASSKTGTSVQVYSDIDDTWTGQSTESTWIFDRANSTSMFTLSAANSYTYSENENAQALWGDAIFASRPSNHSTISTEAGDPSGVRKNFAVNGTLTGAFPGWKKGRVVGIAHDLGTVTGESSVTYAVGYVREQAVNFLGNAYTGYYRQSYPDTLSAISYFLDDYEDANAESGRLDDDILVKSIQVAGHKYSDLVSLSLRQAYGGIDLVIPQDSLDADGVLAFIKEISSDGNANTVDVIFASLPLYYAMDPEYIRLLISPVVQYLATGAWKQPYVVHDIGRHYPNATGHDGQIAEMMPVEETGNLLQLAYAYAIASNNSNWTAGYMPLFQQYADYLVNNRLNISKQLSTNDATGPLTNETNLAIKAAVGLKAFGELSGLSNYSDIGDQTAQILYQDGLGLDGDRTHFTLQYPNNGSTYKVIFNLYPDLLLNLSTFPQSAYDMESTYYPTVRKSDGVALDNRQFWTNTEWNMWAAGTSSDSTREMFVDDIWAMISNEKNTWPLSDRMVVSPSRGFTVGSEFFVRARPTVAGHFSLLALLGPKSLQWTE